VGSSFQYGINSAFKAVDQWQQNIIRNAQGLLQVGYNKTTISIGQAPGEQLRGGLAGANEGGSQNSVNIGGDSLDVGNRSIDFEQGQIDPGFGPTSLAIRGNGFFMVAENLRPGARVFLTRAGDFHYDSQGHLVTPQGLFVMGGSGTISDPPTPVTNPGDGTVDLTKLTLARVPAPGQMSLSNYGDTIYLPNNLSGAIKPFPNGSDQVGFVQSNSIEMRQRAGASAELQVDTVKATQTYKIFKDMLDSFNKTDDDALSLVK
jgi:flagellar hook protein FlgE